MKNIMIFTLAVCAAALFAAFPAASFASDMGTQNANTHQMQPISANSHSGATPAWIANTVSASPINKTNGYPGTRQQMVQTQNSSPLMHQYERYATKWESGAIKGFPGTHKQMEQTLNGSPLMHEWN